MMTGTEVSSRQIDGTANTVPNHVLEKLIYENLLQAPLPVYTEEETAFAQTLRKTYDCSRLPGERTYEDVSVRSFVMEKTQNGTRPINDFIMPYSPSMALSPGSTDVGDVSWLTPTAQFNAVTWASCSPGHSWQNVATGRHAIAHKGVVLAAQVLAATAADLMEQPQILEAARKEFDLATVEGYDCPIGPEVTPN
jgi:aminobenzoyl-glutamate utilization protein B